MVNLGWVDEKSKETIEMGTDPLPLLVKDFKRNGIIKNPLIILTK